MKKSKECNKDLQRLVAEIDQTVSNWDSSLWISTSDSCFSIVESAIDAPQIQKMLWKLKRKAGIGILFIMWSISIWLRTGSMELYLVLVAVFVMGLWFFLHTLFWGTATGIVSRVREFAFISYTNDSFHSFQPIRYQITDDNVKDTIDRLKESTRKLEQVATSGQWKRFQAMCDKFIQDLIKMRSRIAYTRNTLSSAWIGTFSEHYLAKSAGESVEEYKTWFLNVLDAYSITGELDRLRWNVKPDAMNYTDPKALFSLQFQDNIPHSAYVYRNHDNAVSLLDKAFQVLTNEDKILWVNGFAEQLSESPTMLNNSIYSFVCNYQGMELIPEIYVKLAKKPGRLGDTTLEMLERVYNIDTPPDGGKSLKFRFFDRVFKDSNTDAEVKEKARLYRSHFKP